jgi:hypothetical protein
MKIVGHRRNQYIAPATQPDTTFRAWHRLDDDDHFGSFRQPGSSAFWQARFRTPSPRSGASLESTESFGLFLPSITT